MSKILPMLLLTAWATRLAAADPQPPGDFLWDPSRTIPSSAELTPISGVRFSVIKPYEFAKDGYRFLHGVAVCFHKGNLYASFGHNRGGENTDTEEARWCVSHDNGGTWSDVKTIDAGEELEIGISHGAFHSHRGELWAFMGAYRGIMQDVHTRAYVLDEVRGEWLARGVVIRDGFWPMQQPLRMNDGNWIMAGLKVGAGNPPVVAISEGDNFLKWNVRTIPVAAPGNVWGESTVMVKGREVVNISRYGAEAKALVAFSHDFGRTWTKSRPSNLPMATSKPCAGTLSTGQHYLICTTTSDSGNRRAPLTIALSRPQETAFSRVLLIRDADFPAGPGESHRRAALSYPYAVEQGGYLYVGYSNSGGGVGRIGAGRELWNNNSAELAVIPLESLRQH